ncbi:sensor histidine kinase [Haloimpatiens lingqiaonensis]|uniref:sensor histidine kinase n=1 Tax=Haloimpatiens lingqiaonensis TaxID=1380675 RepID=UPI0010FD9722|nr:sensor histidine kinase [Haloimpatiens lingqiaonensis]
MKKIFSFKNRLWFRNKHKGSFKDKLFRGFLLVGILPLLSMTIFFYHNTSKSITSKLDISVKENLEVVSKLIDSSLGSFISISNYISENKEVREILKKKDYNSYEEKFSDIQKIYRITSGVLATQKRDVPIYITGMSRYSHFSTTDYYPPIYENLNSDFFKLIDKRENEKFLYVHRRVDGKDRKDIVMAIGKEIKDIESGEKIGYVVVDLYDDYFNDIFKYLKVYKDNNIFVLDRDGKIITDKINKNKTGFYFYEEYLDEVLKNNKGKFPCTLNNKKYTAYFTTLSDTGLKIVEIIPQSQLYKDKRVIIFTFMLLLILFAVLAIITSFVLSKNISKPINELSDLMDRVEKGDRNVNFSIDTEDEIAHMGNSFNNMLKEINRLIEEVYVKQYLLKEAEFKALKAQVNPHFLYNTLESINWMAKLGDLQGVSTMVTSLGKFLRYSISKKGDIVTIEEEMQQVNNYLTIQKIRYGDKFQVFIEVEEDVYKQNILRLLIQPLVENAITHGLEQKRGKGKLIIKGYLEENIIYIDVIDDGIGVGNSNSSGEKIGLSNVDNRIKIQYGDEYGATLLSEEGFTISRISIPAGV